MIVLGDAQHAYMIARAAHTGFDPEVDRCISRVSVDGNLMGGFIFTNYNGAIIFDHMAGHANWCTPELMWLIFDYQFDQLGVRKVMATVGSNNVRSLDLVQRAGFEHEHSIEDGIPNGKLHLFSMVREKFKWLSLRSRYLKVNGGQRGEHVHVHA